MADPNTDTPTVLGPDANFKGELSFEKGMRLQGRFEGKITTPGRVQISKEAKMQADVDAGAITIEGEVRGNLNINDRIELKQTARYEGDMRAAKLAVDEGAVFSGHVSIGPDAVKSAGGGSKPASQSSNRPAMDVKTPASQAQQPAKA